MEKIETSTPVASAVSDASDRLESFQKKYNVSSKNFVYIIGKNLTLFICMLVPLLLVGFIWVDFQEIIFSTKMISDGIVTVMLFAAGETMMTLVGTGGGKLDEEYTEAKGSYDALVAQVSDIGTVLMGMFCNWQIDLELEQATRIRLSDLRMTPKMWAEVKNLSLADLENKFGKAKAKKLKKIRELKPIELNEAILLYGGEYKTRGGVPISADAYLKDKWHFAGLVLGWLFTGLLVINVAFTMTSDVTLARVFYTIFKFTILIVRMAKGYDRGARAYNTIMVRNYKARSNYLRQYIKFVEDKIYLKLGDKYGDVDELIGETEV